MEWSVVMKEMMVYLIIKTLVLQCVVLGLRLMVVPQEPVRVIRVIECLMELFLHVVEVSNMRFIILC